MFLQAMMFMGSTRRAYHGLIDAVFIDPERRIAPMEEPERLGDPRKFRPLLLRVIVPGTAEENADVLPTLRPPRQSIRMDALSGAGSHVLRRNGCSE